ncbi:phospholipase d3 [Plakobranchus ocellatus]|uniref:Phospholipase d3 n=1 Tax=Plakobranchus ocellatus TaxID=259542 RepID=A0AAV4C499_9GAST|nr:phospholipase d3 [Plakobranchus ocellatus]
MGVAPDNMLLKLLFTILIHQKIQQTAAFYGVNSYGFTEQFKCAETCKFTITESIPENLTYPASAPRMMSTYKAHKRLLERVQSSLYLASCYWTLRGNDTPPYHDYSSYEVTNDG